MEKKQYSPGKLCLLLRPEWRDLLQTMCQYCSFLKSLSLSTVNIMIFTSLLYQHSLDLAMCSWALFFLPSAKTFPQAKKMQQRRFDNTMYLQSQRKHSWLKVLTDKMTF